MLTRHPSYLAAAAALGFSLTACTTLPVTTDVNPTMSVSNCHSYAFANEHVANAEQPAAYSNPLNAQRLKVSIAANLAAKGLQAADRASADCIVGYAMGTRQVFNDYYAGWAGYGGWGGFGRRGGYYGGWGWDGPYVSDETRIAIDLFDAKSRTPIWHASVNQNGSDLTGPNAEVRINAGVTAIFAKFPIGGPPPAAGHAT
ncbi:MAG: DUF4136 domain-containing protein [Gammaproteobacteria bacterium]